MDLSSLQVLERERVLEVLQRDKQLRIIEEDRIKRMKYDLQELRRKGAKSFARQYGERTCARCQRPLGKLWNCGEVCAGCSHRICAKCRVGASNWRCTVCHAYREVKIRSGDWFLEEKARKFPVTTDKYETAGEKLLKVYNVLSYISVVPPTPPPNIDQTFMRSGDFKNSKPFTKSVENLMVSFTSHIRKISISQTDLLKVDSSVNGSHFNFSTQKSLSDSDISKSNKLCKVPSLPNLFKKRKDSDFEGSSNGAEEETLSSENSGGKRGSSSSSISTDCSFHDNMFVTAELELSIVYVSSNSSLEIRVGACRNLSYGDTKKKKCHPYVKVCVLPDVNHKLKTSVKKNTTNPVYNEVLKLNIECHLLFGKRLQATVWHSGTLKRKVLLGEVLLPLDVLMFEDKAMQSYNWYPLCPKIENSDGSTAEPDGLELQCSSKITSTSHGVLR